MTEPQAPTVSPYSTGMDVAGYSVDELFPEVDPEFRPFGTRVLVVLRRVIDKTKSGIVLVQDTKDTEAWNIQVGKLLQCGPLAFKRRDSGEPWPEGVWAQPGDFVMVPRYGGERRSVPAKDGKDVVVLLLNDTDLMGAYTGDPRKVKAYIA
jgi:co-chaperonin GroES (HSP10)